MRFIFALIIGKIIIILTRYLRIGGGSAAPGLYALKIDPEIVNKLARQVPSNIAITGTNGKTTTARILDHFARRENLRVIRNSTGSNLERGVASALIAKANIFGKIKHIDLGIWELDEAAFNKVVCKIKPQILVFLNAFRDQLDRYGEVDKVIKNWKNTLESIDWNPSLLINSGDGNTWQLADVQNFKVYGFSIVNHDMFSEKVVNMSNTFENRHDFQARIIKNNGLEGSEFEITYPNGKLTTKFHIPGLYHIYDFLAAFAAYYLLNLPVKNIQASLNSFSPAFGRVEKINLNGRRGYIFLIKNPTGATQVFETIAPNFSKDDTLLIALNDNFADGKDVSWIWDAEFEKLVPKSGKTKTIRNIICSGTRAQDLAVRLKYAGFNSKLINTENNLQKAIEEIQIYSGKIFILPTYTALLHLQNILTQKGIKQHYWKETE